MTVLPHLSQRALSASRPWLATACLSLLAACGGGGGSDDGGSGSRTLSISASNRDTVAQTTVSAVLGVGNGIGAVGLAAEGPDKQRQSLNAAASAARIGTLPAAAQRQLRAQLRGAARSIEGMKRAQAVIGPFSEACTYGGSASVTLDDANNNGELDAGDTLTMRYTACTELPDVVMSGEMRMQVASFVTLPRTRVAGVLALTALRVSTAEGSATMDGSFGFDYADVDANTERMTITAQSAVTTQLTAGAVTDTVTLAPGYQETDLTELSVLAPNGRYASRTTVTFSGSIGSNKLGGQMQVSSSTPVVMYDYDDFPSSGVVLVQGRVGTLRMTVLSATQVRLELDADDNGVYETSSTVNWTWLV